MVWGVAVCCCDFVGIFREPPAHICGDICGVYGGVAVGITEHGDSHVIGAEEEKSCTGLGEEI
jgi:hypothetical protein